MRTVSIHVKGKVQGVYFRASCKKAATDLGIFGYVMNLHDGSVYIEASGEAMEEFIRWCESGPPSAHVDNITIKDLDTNFSDMFEIRYA